MAGMRTSLIVSDDDPGPPPSSCTTCSKGGGKAKGHGKPHGSWVARHEKALAAALEAQKKLLTAKKAELEANDDTTKANLKKFFGTDSEDTRQEMLRRVNKELELNEQIARHPLAYFRDADPKEAEDSDYAYVEPDDTMHRIYIANAFHRARLTGEDSRAGALVHEMSHFEDIAGTDDKIYGAEDSLQLAKDRPADAMANADSFEYYLEGTH